MSGLLTSLLLLAQVLTSQVSEPTTSSSAPSAQSHLGLNERDEAALLAAASEFDLGRYESCIAILSRAMAGMERPNIEFLNLKGASLVELGRFEEAKSTLLWALDLEPSHFWARFNLAEIQLLQGNLPEARNQFAAIASDPMPEQELITLKLVLIDLRLKDENSATLHLPDWPPVSAPGYAAYAALAQHQGDSTRARDILEMARTLHPDQWNSFLRKTLEESGVNIPD